MVVDYFDCTRLLFWVSCRHMNLLAVRTFYKIIEVNNSDVNISKCKGLFFKNNCSLVNEQKWFEAIQLLHMLLVNTIFSVVIIIILRVKLQ